MACSHGKAQKRNTSRIGKRNHLLQFHLNLAARAQGTDRKHVYTPQRLLVQHTQPSLVKGVFIIVACFRCLFSGTDQAPSVDCGDQAGHDSVKADRKGQHRLDRRVFGVAKAANRRDDRKARHDADIDLGGQKRRWHRLTMAERRQSVMERFKLMA